MASGCRRARCGRIVGLLTYAFAMVSLRLLARTDSTESMVLGFTLLLMIGAGALAIPGWHAIRWAADLAADRSA